MRLMALVTAISMAALLAGCDEAMVPQDDPMIVTRAPSTLVVDPAFEAQLNAFRTQNGL